MSKWLLLIPTQFERKFVVSLVEKFESDSAQEIEIELCGFGPVAAAARTSSLIAHHRPDRVLLLGIAGGYEHVEIGNAYRFASVGCYGVGVGTGASFQPAEKMGWSHWGGQQESEKIGDVVSIEDGRAAFQLVTVCAASQSQSDVDQRRETFPNAVAEDMEGFAVAVACKLAQTRLTIVRGISNVAGVRDKSNWQIEEAMVAAWKLAQQVVTDG